jgi:HEAT repeat protein
MEEAGLYQAWYDAARILGALRATEAIDLLIKYLDFSDAIVRFAVSRRPAVHALIQIGEPAVPKLINALLDRKREIRRNAAEALGFIGGRQAREGLLRALITENDEGITREINRALSNIARARRKS